MKRTITILLIIFCCITTANMYAQTITSGTYAFSRSGFAPTDISTGNTLLIGSNSDDVASAVTDIGFTFWFAGTPYTQFSVNENGLLTLGSTQISGSDAINSMASSTTLPKIAPYWDDLATGTTGSVYYKLTGTAPNRVLIINWNVTVPKNIAGAANALIQLQLSETSGNITFTYGTPAIAANANGYSIGIGNSATDFASVTPTSATAATVAYGTAKDNNTISPGQYTRYNFLPDAAAPTITTTALTSTLSLTNRTFTATIADSRTGVPTTGTNVPRVYFKKNSGSYVSSPGTLTTGTSASGTWSFTIDYSLVGGIAEHDVIYYFVVAQDQSYTRGNPNIASSPTGVVASDVNTITTPPSAPTRYKIGGRLSGTKTVGTGGDYSSLTNIDGLFEDISIGALNGNLTVNVTSDLTSEGGTYSLNAWTNDAGGPYTVTINPVGARTITTSGSNAVLKINGASGVTIDGLNDGTNSLTISSSWGPAVQYSFGASNNTITRTTLTGGGSAVIYFYDGSGTFTKNCSNNTISNSVINALSKTTGIYFGSWATASVGMNNVINNNIIKDFSQYGIHLDRNYYNFTISNNELYQTNAGNYSTGIYIYNPVGSTTISGNKIHDIKSGTGLGVWTAGIYYRFGGGTDVLNIYNNSISLDATTTNTASYQLYGLQMEGAGTSNIYFNSIYIGGTGVVSGNSAGLYRAAGTVNFKDNAVFNARSNTAVSQYYKNYAVRTANLTNFVSDNNLIYANGTSGYLGCVGSTDYSTLDTWTGATGKDSASFSSDPGFTSSTDLTPDVNNFNSSVLNGKGVPVPGITTDMNGNQRNETGKTDIGAYEFTPAYIVISGKTSLAGVTLSYEDGTAKTSSSDSKGNYSFPVSRNWTGTVTPSLEGYTFSPVNISYSNLQDDQSNQNYTASAITYTISGNAGVAGVTLSWTDGTAKTATSDQNGNYTLTVSYKWSGRVKPSKTNYTFTPDSINYSNVLANQTDQNYTAAAAIISANIKVFLEGPFNSGVMKTDLNTKGLIPLTSETPYPAANYGYTAVSVASIPNADIVDWVLVEIRTGAEANTKAIAKPGFLKKDGSIVDVDGTGPMKFEELTAGNYYIVVRHRNHLAIMSSQAVAFGTSIAVYDFTDSQSKAYGTEAMADLSGNGSLFAMRAGDNDLNNVTTSNDYNAVGQSLFGSGYLLWDHNLSGNITTADYNSVGSNLFMMSQVP